MKKIIIILIALISFKATLLSQGYELWSWGYNGNGGLGDGTNIDSNIPKKIGTSNDWKSISAGGLHSIALKNDGTLWAWGSNQYGQLGDGTKTDRYTPIKIGVSTDWKLISSRFENTLALKNDGSLWAWGSNNFGQFGDGTKTNSIIPNKINTISDLNIISGRLGYFTIALKRTNTSVDSDYFHNSNINFLEIKEYIVIKDLNENDEVQIYDLLGNIISKFRVQNENEFHFYKSNFNGVYFVKVISNQNNYFFKFICNN